MALQAGITLLGVATNALEMATAKTALTITSSRKMTIMSRIRARGPTTSPVSAPREVPRFRTLAQMAPKSCTPAKNTVPATTQMNAGSQPQMMAMAGPMMGAAPRHGGEVMTPQDDLVGGQVVHVVPLRVGRRLERRIEPIDLLGDEPRVEAIAEGQRHQTDHCGHDCAHSASRRSRGSGARTADALRPSPPRPRWREPPSAVSAEQMRSVHPRADGPRNVSGRTAPVSPERE